MVVSAVVSICCCVVTCYHYHESSERASFVTVCPAFLVVCFLAIFRVHYNGSSYITSTVVVYCVLLSPLSTD